MGGWVLEVVGGFEVRGVRKAWRVWVGGSSSLGSNLFVSIARCRSRFLLSRAKR